MRAVVLNRPGELRAVETPTPDPPDEDTALVRVRRIGVCGTDVHAWHGRQPFFAYPRILGHELSVEILAIGRNTRGLRAGERCAVEPYLNCGTCDACRLGRTNCCERLEVLGVHIDGGMRERLLVPIRKLHPSSRLTIDQLALVETLCVGAHAVRRAGALEGAWTLVAGAGPIGLSVALFAAAAGARVIVSDPSAARRAFCGRHGSAEHVIDPAGGSLADQLRSVSGRGLPTHVFDATGSVASMRASFDVVAHAGVLVYVGLVQDEIRFPDPDFHRRELTLLASRNAVPDDFAHVMAALESGRVDVRPWITHRAALGDVPDVFAGWTRPESGVVKAMIEVDG